MQKKELAFEIVLFEIQIFIHAVPSASDYFRGLPILPCVLRSTVKSRKS